MTKIEWTEQTWNPTTGCNKISQGCKNCYAEVMHRRLMGMFPKKYSKPFLAGIELHPDWLEYPITISKPTTFFVDSMSDLFHKDVPFEFIARVFSTMAQCPHHTFQILTKRPEVALEYFRKYPNGLSEQARPLANVWIGVSCEDQANADLRIPYLLQLPAAIRFLSCEPLIGKIELRKIDQNKNCWMPDASDRLTSPHIDWVIAGGESTRNARQVHPDWIRSLRDQCKERNVPFFFKQWGYWLPLEFDTQPPFRFFSNDGRSIDAHGIDLWDNENERPGKWNGQTFMDPMEAIVFCVEEKEAQCDFLAQGSHQKFLASLDGKFHREMPPQTTLNLFPINQIQS